MGLQNSCSLSLSQIVRVNRFKCVPVMQLSNFLRNGSLPSFTLSLQPLLHSHMGHAVLNNGGENVLDGIVGNADICCSLLAVVFPVVLGIK